MIKVTLFFISNLRSLFFTAVKKQSEKLSILIKFLSLMLEICAIAKCAVEYRFKQICIKMSTIQFELNQSIARNHHRNFAHKCLKLNVQKR